MARATPPPSSALTVGSLFSGIGGFDLGFQREGFDVRWQVEIDPDAVKRLERHWPTVQRFKDINAVVYGSRRQRDARGLVLAPVDVIVGGFPCQDLSVAGQRKGLDGSRSGLFFAFMRALRIMRARFSKPDFVVIENVPGLLTSQRGRDFHTVLSTLADCGFRRAYRVLDSRYFGVAQRRRRVFIVGRAGSARGRADEVLLEPARGTRRVEAGDAEGADVAATLRGRSARRGVNEPGRGGEDDSNLVFGVHANQRGELRTSPVAGSLNAHRSGKQLEGVLSFDNRLAAAAVVPATLRANRHSAQPMVLASSGERERALTASMHKGHDDDTDTLVASPRGDGRDNIVAATLLAPNGGQRTDDLNQTFTPTQYGVRRLTPLECERVQGFPDGWTCLCGQGHRGSRYCSCADTPRYRGLGNGVTVNVAQWIARRIKAVSMQTTGAA